MVKRERESYRRNGNEIQYYSDSSYKHSNIFISKGWNDKTKEMKHTHTHAQICVYTSVGTKNRIIMCKRNWNFFLLIVNATTSREDSLSYLFACINVCEYFDYPFIKSLPIDFLPLWVPITYKCSSSSIMSLVHLINNI